MDAGTAPRPIEDFMDVARVRHWLVDQALPLWRTRGLDGQGGFVEQLDLDGNPEPDVVRRIRVQARQIYVYAHATRLGLGDHRDVVTAGIDWLLRHGWDADEGGFHHRLGGRGEPADRRKDTYDHAFILLALANALRIDPQERTRKALTRTLDFVQDRLAAPDGETYLEGAPAALPRRQNPHMHLLEAFLAVHEATQDPAPLAAADRLVALFRARFFAPETETLTEFFTDDWQPAEDPDGKIVEPGHHFEWVYLLHAHARLSGRDTPGPEADALFDVARARGLDPVSGLGFDEIWRDGGVKSATKRCWVQTEALRTHVLLGRRAPTIAREAGAWLDRLFRYYLDPAPAGTWLDRMGPDNRSIATAIPASTLYHLMSAFAFMLEADAPDCATESVRAT